MTRAVIVAHDGVLADQVHLAAAVLGRLPGVRVTIAGPRRGVLGGAGGPVLATQVHAEVLLADALVVPGLLGVERLAGDAAFVEWLGGLVDRAVWTIALSVGTVLVAATGRLEGAGATSWLARPLLERYGAVAAPGRVARTGRIVSASGTASAFEVLRRVAVDLVGADEAQRALREVEARALAAASAPGRRGAQRPARRFRLLSGAPDGVHRRADPERGATP